MGRRKSIRESVIVSVSIGTEQDTWLRKHPEINLSEKVRELINKMRLGEIKYEKKILE